MGQVRSIFCVAAVLALVACSGARPTPPYDVQEVPLAQISRDLATGYTTSVAVTEAYIARIKAYDAALHAVIAIAPDALQQAQASDARRRRGKALGPLDGVPILLKDNIDVAGIPTTAGSFALVDNWPREDSEIARRLRAAGAVLLGKTNTTQFANFRTRFVLNGSTVGGVPHNPYDTTRTPCGSSNGSGIAAAVSFAAAAIGTETSGSIICPSAVMSLVGLKPTVALISRRGIVPISHNQDTAGPMARSVTDAAMLLNVMVGSDPGDAPTAASDSHKADYVKNLDPNALKGKRIGVVRGLSGYDIQSAAPFEAALDVLTAQGAVLVDVPRQIFEDLAAEMQVILLHDFKIDLNDYLAHTAPGVKTRTLAELIAFSKTDPREKMHRVDLLEAAQKTGGDDTDYKRILAHAQDAAGAHGIGRGLTEYNVSALVVPTLGPAPHIAPDGTDPSAMQNNRNISKEMFRPSLISTAAIAGYPHLTLPMGEAGRLPVGISFIGAPWSESMLLSFGYAYEQATHKRLAPPPLTPAPVP